MARAYLGLGANLGEPGPQIEEAVRRLDALSGVSVVARSTMITSKPWGKTDQPDFRNMVIAVETALSPQDLLGACLGVENAMGRVRGEKWGPRVIDIDVIAYDEVVLRSERLTLPHPHAHERDFVIDPLQEIAPEVAERIVRRGGQ